MKSPLEFIVPWVKDSEPYSAKHMDVAWENPEIIRLMSNENLIAPAESVMDAIVEAARMGNFYPGSGPELRKRLGEKAGLTAENVVLGNGSTDIIDMVVQTFIAPGDEALMAMPTFPMYEARVKIHGGKAVQVPMTPDFEWDIEAMLKAVTARTKLLFVCSPNNPSGNQIPMEQLERLLELGIPTFFDEAYYELENDVKTRAGMLKKYPHMVINRTMSKAFGLAGFRLGYLLCSEELAGYINRVKMPFNVSLIALAAGLASLKDEADQRRKRENIIEGRNYITDEVNKIPGLKAYPSEGNFVLINAGVLKKTATEIRDWMKERGLFIRPMTAHHMGEGFIRVTIGTPPQNQLFIKLLKQYVEENRKG